MGHSDKKSWPEGGTQTKTLRRTLNVRDYSNGDIWYKGVHLSKEGTPIMIPDLKEDSDEGTWQLGKLMRTSDGKRHRNWDLQIRGHSDGGTWQVGKLMGTLNKKGHFMWDLLNSGALWCGQLTLDVSLLLTPDLRGHSDGGTWQEEKLWWVNLIGLYLQGEHWAVQKWHHQMSSIWMPK